MFLCLTRALLSSELVGTPVKSDVTSVWSEGSWFEAVLETCDSVTVVEEGSYEEVSTSRAGEESSVVA